MYWKRRYFVLNGELYGKIWSMNTTCKNVVSAVLKKRRNGFCIDWISV